MKFIFKKKFGLFTWYSNGRTYVDLDGIKKKPKKVKEPRDMEGIKQELNSMTDDKMLVHNITMKSIIGIVAVGMLLLSIMFPPLIIISILIGYCAYKYDVKDVKKNINND